MKIPTPEELAEYEAGGWVRSARHPELPLTIWCYTHQTQYENNWTDTLKIARGIVFDDDGNLVQLPLPKIFNVGDPNAPIIGRRPFQAYDKLDGSLVLVTQWGDHKLITTKGSFTSPQALAAEEFLKGWVPTTGHTFLFEYIAPDNRIVVDYEDYEGLVLLGAVRHADGFDHFNPYQLQADTGWYGDVVAPRKFHLPKMLADIQDPANGENREGFVVVVETPEGPAERVKLKFASYVALHAMMSGLTNKKVWELLLEGTLDDYAGAFPDETYEAIQKYAGNVLRDVGSILSEAERVAREAFAGYNERAGQARFIQTASSARHIQSAAFAILDHDTDKARTIAFKAVKPEPTLPLVQTDEGD